MEKSMTADKIPLKIGKTVVEIEGDKRIADCFSDFQITRGATLTPLFPSLSGKSRAYLCGNTVVAIRKSDEAKIKVK